jgi:hypothetical protein
MYLDEISRWLQAQGVHPVLGGIIFGFLLAKIFSRRTDSSKVVIDSSHGLANAGAIRAAISNAGTQIVSSKISMDAKVSEQIVDALKKGNKIEAIKVFRNATGVGLTEAKSAIEAIELQSISGK